MPTAAPEMSPPPSAASVDEGFPQLLRRRRQDLLLVAGEGGADGAASTPLLHRIECLAEGLEPVHSENSTFLDHSSSPYPCSFRAISATPMALVGRSFRRPASHRFSHSPDGRRGNRRHPLP